MRISDWSSDVCSSDLLDGFKVAGLDEFVNPGSTDSGELDGSGNPYRKGLDKYDLNRSVIGIPHLSCPRNETFLRAVPTQLSPAQAWSEARFSQGGGPVATGRRHSRAAGPPPNDEAKRSGEEKGGEWG